MEGHDSDCYCEKCEGEYRLNMHRPNSCLFDGDQSLRYDGGRGVVQKLNRRFWGANG